MRDAAASIGGEPGRYAYDDFVIFNFPCYRAVLASMAKGALTNLLREFGAQSRLLETPQGRGCAKFI